MRRSLDVPAIPVPQSLGLVRSSPVEREFERLYQRYVADVYRYAVYVLRDAVDAEDVTQAAFLNAFRAFQRGERPRKPRSWLLTIVHNECRRHFRTKARRPSEVELDEGLTADTPPDDDVPTPEEIRRALGELSFNQRSALVMRELEGRSYTEIAQTLELSVSAVETLLFRARRALREQLEGALTCGEAELALSKQLDRRLTSDEQAGLRAHLRACTECSRLARRQRAQRAALRSLGPVPLPGSLSTLFGGGGGGAGGLLAGGSALGGGVALKAAAILAGGVVATGVGLGAAKAGSAPASEPAHVAPLRQAAAAPSGSASSTASTWAVQAPGATSGSFGLGSAGTVGALLLANDLAGARADGGADHAPRAKDTGTDGGGGGGSAQAAPSAPRPRLLPAPKSPVAIPRVTVPRVTVPKVAVPKVAVPKVTVPKVTVPKVTVPKPAAPKPAAPKPEPPVVTVPPLPKLPLPPPPPPPPPPVELPPVLPPLP